MFQRNLRHQWELSTAELLQQRHSGADNPPAEKTQITAESCEHMIRIPGKGTTLANWVRVNLIIILVPKKSDSAIKHLLKKIFLTRKAVDLWILRGVFPKGTEESRDIALRGWRARAKKLIMCLLESCQLMPYGLKVTPGWDRSGRSGGRTGAICVRWWSMDLGSLQTPQSFFPVAAGETAWGHMYKGKVPDWPDLLFPIHVLRPRVLREPIPGPDCYVRGAMKTRLTGVAAKKPNKHHNNRHKQYTCWVFCVCRAWRFYVVSSRMTLSQRAQTCARAHN